jgi:hypothetical protein
MKCRKVFLIKLRAFCVTFSSNTRERASRELTSHLNPDNAADCAESIGLGLSSHPRSVQIDAALCCGERFEISRRSRYCARNSPLRQGPRKSLCLTFVFYLRGHDCAREREERSDS